jgi:hypothetical protein
MERNDKTCVGLDLKITEEPKAFLAGFEGSKRMNGFKHKVHIPIPQHSFTTNVNNHENFHARQPSVVTAHLPECSAHIP